MWKSNPWNRMKTFYMFSVLRNYEVQHVEVRRKKTVIRNCYFKTYKKKFNKISLYFEHGLSQNTFFILNYYYQNSTAINFILIQYFTSKCSYQRKQDKVINQIPKLCNYRITNERKLLFSKIYNCILVLSLKFAFQFLHNVIFTAQSYLLHFLYFGSMHHFKVISIYQELIYFPFIFGFL